MLQKILTFSWAISLGVLHNYFDSLTRLFSDLCLQIFRYFSKTVLPVYRKNICDDSSIWFHIAYWTWFV